MPVRLISSEFKDVNGNILPNYRANAGSLTDVKFTIGSVIECFSLNTSWNINYTTDTITWNGGNWLAEGFRLGDSIEMTYFTSGGSGVYAPFTLTIGYISETEMQFTTAIPHQLQSDEYMRIRSVTDNFDELIVNYAHVINETGGNDLSLIDGNKTSYNADVSGLAVSSTIALTQTGHKSGEYGATATVKRIADVGGERRYEISFDNLIQSGIFLPTNFTGNDCLKLFVNFEASRFVGETDYHQIFSYSELANTGWFNEAYNNATPNSLLYSNISDLYYNAPLTFDIAVTDLANVRIGACYVPINDTYYKDKYNSQSELGMYLNCDETITVNPSLNAPNGAGYSISINTVTSASGIKTLNVTFNPNANLKSWFELDTQDQDRRFVLWVEVGNVNWLVFDGQLSEVPKAVLNLDGTIYADKHGFKNFGGQVFGADGLKFNTEDDISLDCEFKLTKNKLYDRIRTRIVALNLIDNTEFTLDVQNYDISSFPLDGVGKLQLFGQFARILELPTTFIRRLYRIEYKTSLDNATEYGVRLHHGALLNWRYWEQLSGVNSYFFPNYNKDWNHYQVPSTWVLAFVVDVFDADGYQYRSLSTFNNYTYDELVTDYWQGISEIKFINPETGLYINNFIDGGQTIIEANHLLEDGWIWSASVDSGLPNFGQISAEVWESSPRHEISTFRPIDGTHPSLLPLTGQTATLTLTAPNLYTIYCIFDATQIDTSKGIKFTSKIFGFVEEDLTGLITTDGDPIVDMFGNQIIILE